MLVLSIPAVQTRLANIATQKINEKYNTNIVVKKVDLSMLGSVRLKGIELRDHHQDTLIFVEKLKTSLLSARKVINNEIDLDAISLDGVSFHLKTHKGEDNDNLSIFLEKVEDDSPKDTLSSPFILQTKNIYLNDLNFKLIDANEKEPIVFSALKGGGSIQDFLVVDSDVSMKIRGLHFVDDRNINVTSLSTNFSYSKTKMLFTKTTLQTNNKTKLQADVSLHYKIKDFQNFNDRVRFKAKFKNSAFAIKDLKKFYNELSGNDVLYFTTNFYGTLNNFSLDKFNLKSRKNLQIKGDLGFVNSFNSERGFVFDANVSKVSSNYDQLKRVLPNVLGKTIPTEFRKLGNFTVSGLMKVTPEQMEATVNISSEIGGTISDLQLSDIDDIDNAKYSGEVSFINFDFGKFLDDDNFGKVSLKADVLGEGFNPEVVNTTIIGTISELNFRGYAYKDLNVNGQFENKKFDGFLKAEDENFKLTFEGLADFSSAIHKFDFTADVAHIDLKKTNLFPRDSIATLKGNIKLNVSGNTFDDVVGKAKFKNLIYTNQKQAYKFKEFEIQSAIADSIQTIKVTSSDIVNGELKGKFKFKELLPVAQNALGSVYANYTPIATKPNQFIDFNFTIYNQIVDIFLPEISIGSNTKVKGSINSNTNAVKLIFSSPKVSAYDNVIDKFTLRLDNKNKLYNTHLTANKIATKYYDLHKLNLLNRTVNDTLFFKSTFVGGKKQTEKFNLDFFYTIDDVKNSVVGIQKSTFNFKGNDWKINSNNNQDNKLVFSLKDNVFKISPFDLISKSQKIQFQGDIIGKDKDLKANFTDVSLKSFLPDIEDLKLEGLLNGAVSLIEKNGKTRPLANIEINDLIVNEFSQGTLKAKVKGQTLDKYDVDVSIRDYKYDNVKAVGKLDFSPEKPTMDMRVNFMNYELNGFSDFGGDVITNLRGLLSGSFTAKGEIKNPNFKGELNLKDAGLTFPYLNIDYDFVENTDITLKQTEFIIKNMTLQDTKYDTKGNLSGSIAHQDFERWALSLDLNTGNLLVLDTKEADEIPYYGKAFIRGNARFRGQTSNLIIDVNAKTEEGTVFVIPLSDVTTVSNYKLIRFKTNESKVDKNRQIDKVKGLNLKINLEVTKDAIAQVVIDKVSGSDLKGSGEGNLQIEIDTRGKFLMNGDLAIENGTYNFKYGGIISKPFRVQKGGTISWTGSPYDAELDLTAIYQTKANPAQLLDNINSSRKIPIDLYTKISGNLFDSRQDFDIKIPNANSAIASELDFIINENDLNTKMRHFVLLLTTGTFYNEERLGESVSAGLTGTAADIASSIISSMINSEGSKFKLGLGFTQADRNDITGINTDDQVDLSVSTKFGERFIVNGKVGVPVGANTQTSVVGEVKVEVLLNEEGSLRGTVFNRPNDIQYSLEEEGYTQGVGLSYQVDFNNAKELAEKLGLKKRKKKVIKKDTVIKKRKSRINFKTKKDTIKLKNEPNTKNN